MYIYGSIPIKISLTVKTAGRGGADLRAEFANCEVFRRTAEGTSVEHKTPQAPVPAIRWLSSFGFLGTAAQLWEVISSVSTFGTRFPGLSRDEQRPFEGANRGFDKRDAAMQHCSMTAIPVSKRGTVTLPPEVRRKLGLESVPHPMLLVELREDGVFLHPATAVPVRDIPLQQMQKWIEDDEKDAEKFWKKEKSSR